MKTTVPTSAKSKRVSTKPTGAVMVPVDLTKRRIKQGQAVSTILRRLSNFEWDFTAMKRV